MFLKLTNLWIERNKGRFKEQSNIDMKYVYQSDTDNISRILTIEISRKCGCLTSYTRYG